MPAIFFTGFPGFLCSELLPRVLTRSPTARGVCLVQPRYSALALERLTQIEHAHPDLRGRIDLRSGDITQPDLGIASSSALRRDVAEIYHLAAVYDLSVSREVGMRVNVEGTRHVLDFAETCASLRCLHYVSTCFVSGRYAGIFRESDLQCGQPFNNAYEETKYLAEVEVRGGMSRGLPVAIYRPAIVVGDSTTGATQKYDGPYYAIQWLLRQPRVALMPVVGGPKQFEFNVVPRDFVVDAIDHIGARDDCVGMTYHLADPRPLTVDRLLTALAEATGRLMIRIPLPIGAAKWSIEHVPGVYRTLRIPSSTVDYFVHPTRYDTANAVAALAGSGIRCPAFESYARRLVAFARAHPEIGSSAMA
jgi:thioester reductase-like protein